MSIEAFAARLRDLELFRGLEPEQLMAIARNMERIVFKPGQRLLEAGGVGDGAFVIVSGDAETLPLYEDEQPVSIEPGSLVGEMAMLIEHQHKIGVIARGPVRALKISRSALHKLMLEDGALADVIGPLQQEWQAEQLASLE